MNLSQTLPAPKLPNLKKARQADWNSPSAGCQKPIFEGWLYYVRSSNEHSQ